MKKLLLPLLLLAVLLLFGCGKTNDAKTPDDNAAPDVSANDDENAVPADAGQLDFTTVDFDGNTFTTADLAEAKVVLLNFWEPWCGPCVGEIPDLARLYEEYKDQGLLIVGAYTSDDMDGDIRSLIEENNVTYPFVRVSGNMGEFMTNYVPTTVFADGSGKIISAEPVVGANSYDSWKAMIEDYLAK
ncbi:MAG: TlpA family protein disulfide reductase [Clostridia bacterium]|nr:TlpA family protein disulfide reductase [Clostridia bacterium]